MKELDVIDLPDGRRGTVVYVHPTARMIIVEVGSELIDYTIEENGLKEISRMTVGPEDHSNHLVDSRKAADQGDVADMTDWTRKQMAERLFTDHGRIEKLVQIFATEGVEAALELLDGTPEEDEEAYQAALSVLDEDEWDKE